MEETRDFVLYRVQLLEARQAKLFAQPLERESALREALSSKPTVQKRSGVLWHVGNVVPLDSHGLYFAIGRSRSSKVSVLDENGDFQQQAAEVAPYTHCLLDTWLQVLAVARDSTLAPSTRTVANQVQLLISESPGVQLSGYKVLVDEIQDPTDFISVVRNAFAVTRFKVTFHLPNVFDAEEDFQKPLQRSVQAMRASRGTATMSGDDLDRKAIETASRAAAAVGSRPRAWVKDCLNAKPKQRTMGIDPAQFSAPPPELSQPERRGAEILETLRSTYEGIRRRRE